MRLFLKKILLKSGQKVKINKSTLGIELEVCYLIKKSFFLLKDSITMKNVTKYISHMAPCIEVVGYRQRKKGITVLVIYVVILVLMLNFLLEKEKNIKN